MTGRVDYHLEKYLLTEAGEPERLTRQWAEVMRECHDQKSGAEERLRLALLNVDYVTSFELPFRLLLTRAPQLIDGIRNEFQLSQKNVLFNGKRFGCVYSLKQDLNGIKTAFNRLAECVLAIRGDTTDLLKQGSITDKAMEALSVLNSEH